MRLLFAIFLAALLVGCGRARTLPASNEVIVQYASLEQICDDMRTFTIQSGFGRLGRKERRSLKQAEENLVSIPAHPMIKQDMAEVLQTLYLLPIETNEDLNAFANLVYRNCILKNQ